MAQPQQPKPRQSPRQPRRPFTSSRPRRRPPAADRPPRFPEGRQAGEPPPPTPLYQERPGSSLRPGPGFSPGTPAALPASRAHRRGLTSGTAGSSTGWGARTRSGLARDRQGVPPADTAPQRAGPGSLPPAAFKPSPHRPLAASTHARQPTGSAPPRPRLHSLRSVGGARPAQG